MKRISNEHGFIVSWLFKLALGFALVALVLYEAGSIGVNFFTLDSTATDIAVKMTVGRQPGVTPRQDELEAEARALAKESGAKLVSVEITPEKSLVVKIKRRADTLVIHRIGFAEDWNLSTAEGRAGTT